MHRSVLLVVFLFTVHAHSEYNQLPRGARLAAPKGKGNFAQSRNPAFRAGSYRGNEDTYTYFASGDQSEYMGKDPYSPKLTGYNWPPPSGSLLGKYKNAAVVCDSGICSDVARKILVKGGNAVEATIAATVCVGITNMESNGLGGGFIMTIYNKSEKACSVIDAREVAPAAATGLSVYQSNPKDSSVGYKSVGIPGEIAGHWMAFSGNYRSGKVTWKDLIQPSIDVLENGVPISHYTANAYKQEEEEIKKNEDMRKFLSVGGKPIEEGMIFKSDKLLQFLKDLADAKDAYQFFYQNTTTLQKMESEFASSGKFLTAHDFQTYKPITHDDSKVLKNQLNNDLTICGPPLPSSFAVTQAIIAIMFKVYDKEKLNPKDLKSRSQFYHRILEAEKFAYALRTKLGGSGEESVKETVKMLMSREFINEAATRIIINNRASNDKNYYIKGSLNAVTEDHGTSHTSVVDKNGNAVSCTSSINLWFGSKRVSSTYGFIWNDQMDDFTTSDQPNQFGFQPNKDNNVLPGRKPMSSMSPLVIYDKKGEVVAAAGATGGSKIIASLANALVRALLFKESIKEAIDAPYAYNKFFDNSATSEYENDFPKYLVNDLVYEYGQKMQKAVQMKSTVQAIVRKDGYLYANSDGRRTVHMYPVGY